MAPANRAPKTAPAHAPDGGPPDTLLVQAPKAAATHVDGAWPPDTLLVAAPKAAAIRFPAGGASEAAVVQAPKASATRIPGGGAYEAAVVQAPKASATRIPGGGVFESIAFPTPKDAASRFAAALGQAVHAPAPKAPAPQAPVARAPAVRVPAPMAAAARTPSGAASDTRTPSGTRSPSGTYSLVSCPACRTKLRMDAAKRAALEVKPDVWLKCPACNDRFRLPAASVPSSPDLRQAPDSSRHSQDAGLQAAGLHDAGPYRLGGPDHVPMLVELAETPARGGFRPGLVWSGLAVLLVFAVAGTAVLFARSAPPVDGRPDLNPAPVARPGPDAPGYPDGRLASDLSTLRRNMRRAPSLETMVDYQGPAWRLYDYFSGAWAPASCQNWSAVRLWSLKTSRGFKARGVCAPGERGIGGALEIEVTWRGDSAVVTSPGRVNTQTVHLAGRRPS